MTRLGVDVLRRLGLQIPLPIPQEWVVDVRFVYQGRTIHVGGHPQLIVFHRKELDAHLAAEARLRGVIIRQNEPVEQIRFDEQGVLVKTGSEEYHARAVVGADGAKGITRKLFLEYGEVSRVARLLEVLSPALLTAPEFQDGYAVFDFSPTKQGLQGYFWDFPALVGGMPHFNRGVYDARMAASRERAKLPGLLARGLVACGQDPQQAAVEGHPVHWFSPRNRFSMPRLLLVGDAAGVDPLFGEGIAPALAYGELAAATLRDAFAREEFTFREYRRQILRSRLGQNLTVRWAIAWFSYRLSGSPVFMQMLWALGSMTNFIFPQPEQLAQQSPGDEHARQVTHLIKE